MFRPAPVFSRLIIGFGLAHGWAKFSRGIAGLITITFTGAGWFSIDTLMEKKQSK